MKYTAKILNNEKKEARTEQITALDAQEAHKNIFEKINSYTEEIVEITDSEGNCSFNLKHGFVN